MRNVLLTGFALACAASAFAGQTAGQTPTATPTAASTAPTMGSANKTMTIVGCVGGGASATDPFMLSNVSLDGVGATATAGNAPVATSSAPDHPTTAAMPAGATGSTAAVITTGSTTVPVGTPPSATAAGTAAGTAGTSPTAGTTGTTAGTPAPAGTVGTGTGMATTMRPASGTAPATGSTMPGSAAMASSRYRLSGYDVSGFRGQRVQMVGSLVEPSAATGRTTATAGTGAREFKVQSVQPTSGSCSQP